jgi:hypothetical protein
MQPSWNAGHSSAFHTDLTAEDVPSWFCFYAIRTAFWRLFLLQAQYFLNRI